MSGTAQQPSETREFQAEVKQLLDIVVNSLYTDREIFLRELISNAADALEKYRYESLTSREESGEEVPLEISIELDDKEHTLTITDTGTGMTAAEPVENLGHRPPGSRNLSGALATPTGKDLNLIGQFGVVLFRLFMVASRVRV